MTPPGDPGRAGVRRAAVRALEEDRIDADRTTRAVLPRRVAAVGTVVAQARGVLSGTGPATAAARSGGVRARRLLADGAALAPGRRVLLLTGDARRILAVERTVLNFLMHASGVATATARSVRAAGGRLEVWGTRKTLPGLRDLEKAAIGHGGGRPHRRDLASGLLVKSNHLAFVPLEEAVRRARGARRRGERVEVEVRSAAEAVRAARAGAEALLIDNRSPRAARAIVRALEREGLRRGRWVELSGGIGPASIGRYRRVGADAASLGALTHSAAAVPFHLVVRPVALRRRAG
jgi:nicotinate-nucleotide pyrophosphorylase (carboxylating)